MKTKHEIKNYQTWMTVVYDRSLKIIDIINPQYCMLLQLSEDDLLGRNIDDLESITDKANSGQAAIIARNVRKAFQENRNIYFEYTTTHKDNTITYAVCYGEITPDDLLYINVIKIDEENIFEAREGFTNYIFNVGMNNISVGVIMRHIADNGSKKYILFNNVAKELFECDDVVSSPFWIQGDDDAADMKALQLRDPLKIEKVIRDDDGNIKRWIVLTKKKITSKAGGSYIITTMIDITERRKNEIIIEQQLALLDSMYMNMPVGIILYDKNGNMISINEKVLDIFGIMNKEKLLGANIFDEPNVPKWVREKLTKGEDVEYESEYSFDSSKVKFTSSMNEGKSIILAIKASVIRSKNGKIDGYLQICEDVTDKRTKQSIFDLIFKNIPLGIILYDKNGKLMSINQQNRDIMGINSDVDLTGLNLFEEPHLNEENAQALKRGEDVSFEIDYAFQDIYGYFPTNHKSVKRLLIIISVVRSEDTIIGYLLTNQDKTKARNRELLLEQTSAKLASVFNSMVSAIEIFDVDGCMVDCNERDLKMFGIENKQEYINERINFIKGPNLPKEYITKIQEGQDVNFELWYDFDLVKNYNYYHTTKSGKICIEAKCASIRTEKDELLGYIFEINDITLTKIQERKLIEAHNNLEIALAAGHVSVWIFDIHKRMFTPMFGTIFAGKQRSLKAIYDHIHPGDLDNSRKLFKELVSGQKESANFTFRLCNTDNNDFKFYESEMNVIRDDDGKVFNITGTLRDVTDRCLKTIELENARKSIGMVMEASDMLAWDYDIFTKKYRILYGNKLIGKHSAIADSRLNYHPDDLIRYNSLINELRCGNIETGTVDTRIKDDDGEFYTFENTISSVRNPEGKIVGYIGSMYDMTDRIKRQMQLEEQTQKTNLINKACDIIQWDYIIEKQRIIISSNDIDLQSNGLRLNQLLEYIHPQDRRIVKEAFEIADNRRSETIHFEARMKDEEDKEYISIVVDGVGIKDKNGDIIKYTGIRRDESKWVRINNELTASQNEVRLSNKILNEIVERIPGPVFIKDVSDGFKYVRVNQAFCELIKKSYNEIDGKTVFDIFDEVQAKLNHEQDMSLVEGDPIMSYESTVIVDCKPIYLNITKSLVKLPNGNDAIIGIIMNTTEMRNMNNELLKAKEKAEESDRLKSAFLANMSHEIRTPLNAIVGFSDLLSYCDDPKEKETYSQIISTNNSLLLRLISDILDLSKIEAGLMEMKYEKFDMAAVNRSEALLFKQRMINSDVEFVSENPYSKCVISLDKNRLVQVGTNFVTNAMKYTKEGRITMGYVYENGGIKIYVTDTGIGIDRDKYDKVFERFEKLDNFAQGFGLGLSICKAITEAMHGKIGFESAKGVGSIFWAWFPTEAEIE